MKSVTAEELDNDKENDGQDSETPRSRKASLPGSPSTMPTVGYKMILAGVDCRGVVSVLYGGESHGKSAANNFRNYVKRQADLLGVTGRIHRAAADSCDVILEFEGSWEASNQFMQFLTECQSSGMVESITQLERFFYHSHRFQSFEISPERKESFIKRSLHKLMHRSAARERAGSI
jgi:acylphosphatase